MSSMPLISIIMPSFRDTRILSAIASIRMFDDIDTVRLLVIDGGSDQALLDDIAAALRPGDVFVAEPDKGIFDALNKGLDRVLTPHVGWLGSDDMFSGAVRASDVVSALAGNDVFVASLYITSGARIQRATRAHFSGRGLVRYGLHNPHYSTFGRAELLCAERFDVHNIAADIGYFLKIFARQPRVATTERVAVLQEEGGFSNKSKTATLRVNRAAFAYYRDFNSLPVAVICLGLKLGYKLFGQIRYKLAPQTWDREFPPIASLVARAKPA